MGPTKRNPPKKDMKVSNDNGDSESSRLGSGSPTSDDSISHILEKQTNILAEQAEKQSIFLAEQAEKRFSEFTLGINETLCTNISQVENNFNIKIATLASDIFFANLSCKCVLSFVD